MAAAEAEAGVEAAAPGYESDDEGPAEGAGPGPGGGKGAKKCALFLAYLGEGYSGMQHNPGARTIEGDLLAALKAAGAVAGDWGFPEAQWARAARTDKGVSALANVVSLRILHPMAPDLLERINAALPAQIRVLGLRRVTRGFNARMAPDRRRYEYVLPLACFDPRHGQDRASREAAAAAAAAQLQAEQAALEAAREAAAAGQPAAAAPGDDTEAAAAPDPQACAQGVTRPQPAVGIGQEAEAPAAARAQAEPASLGVSSQSAPEGAAPGAAAPKSAQASGPAAAAASEAEPARPSAAAAEAPLSSLTEPPGVSQEDAVLGAAQPGQGQSEGGTGLQQEALLPTEAEQEAPGAAPAAEGPGLVCDEAFRERINAILRAFQGTHSYHNFTARPGEAVAASLVRFIASFTCEGAYEIQGRPWVRLVVLGQSFVMHQIRKMVGMAVAVARGLAPLSAIQTALSPKHSLTTPLAPEAGLHLEEPLFEGYNRKWAGPGRQHPALLVGDFSPAIEQFRVEQLLPSLARTQGAFVGFLRSLNPRNYTFGGGAPEPRPHGGPNKAATRPSPWEQRKRRGEGQAPAQGDEKRPAQAWGPAGIPRRQRGGRGGAAGPAPAVPAHLQAEWSD